MEAKEIAVRLYENKKHGTTYGKGLFHSAVFNASADVLGRKTKFLLDFYPYEKFEHIAKPDESTPTRTLLAFGNKIPSKNGAHWR